jgi:hypothetical protein
MIPEERRKRIELYGNGFNLLFAALRKVPTGA